MFCSPKVEGYGQSFSYNSSPTGLSDISWLRSQGIRRETALSILFRKVAFLWEKSGVELSVVVNKTIVPLNHLVHEFIGLLRAS